MPEIIGQAGIDVGLNLTKAEQDFNAFAGRIEKRNLKITVNNPLGSISKDVNQFESSLKAAEARILAFTSVTAQLFVLQRALQEIAKATVEVDKSLRDINVILGQSDSQLSKFGQSLFKVANDTGQSFDNVAAAATEFSRQGLGVEQTLLRTRDALILSRLASLDTVTATEVLTSTVNSFSKSLLNTTDIVNKLARVDGNFAVSSKDLAESISRVGSTAQDVGVDLNQLIALTTSVQQVTARGGAAIGNSFKTIFTRIGRPQTLEYLEKLGIQVKDTEGTVKPATDILLQLAQTYSKVGAETQNVIVQQVAGVHQANILRAVLGDLAKNTSVYNSALLDSQNATDEAITRNAKLNESYSSILNALQNNVKQTFASFGKLTIGPLFGALINPLNSILESINNSKVETGTFTSIGATIGKGIVDGIGSFISGPGIALFGVALFKLTSIVGGFALTALKNLTDLRSSLDGQSSALNSISAIKARIEATEKSSLSIARQRVGLLEQEISLLSVLSGRAVASVIPVRSSRGAAGGFVPNGDQLNEVSRAIAGGYQPGDVKNIHIPGEGNIVYNTAETIKNFSGLNQPAILPPKASAAGREYKESFQNRLGFDPYAAEGFIPSKPFSRNVGQLPSPIESAVQGDIVSSIDKFILQIKQGRESTETLKNKSIELGSQYDLTSKSVQRIQQIFISAISPIERANKSFEEAQTRYAQSINKLTIQNNQRNTGELDLFSKQRRPSFQQGELFSSQDTASKRNDFSPSAVSTGLRYGPLPKPNQNISPEGAVDYQKQQIQRRLSGSENETIYNVKRSSTLGLTDNTYELEQKIYTERKAYLDTIHIQRRLTESQIKTQENAKLANADKVLTNLSVTAKENNLNARKSLDPLGLFTVQTKQQREESQLQGGGGFDPVEERRKIEEQAALKRQTFALEENNLRQQLQYSKKISSLQEDASKIGFFGRSGRQSINELQTLSRADGPQGLQAQSALTAAENARAGALQSKLLIASLVAPIVAQIGKSAIGDETKFQRGAGETVGQLGNVASFAAIGASTGLPFGAAIGALGGALVGLPSIVRAFTSELPDLQKAFEKLQESSSKVTAATADLVSSTEKLRQIRRGEITATNGQVAELESKQASSVDSITKFSPEAGAKARKFIEQGNVSGLSEIQSNIDRVTNQTKKITELQNSFVKGLEENSLFKVSNSTGVQNPLANAKEGKNLGFTFPPVVDKDQRIIGQVNAFNNNGPGSGLSDSEKTTFLVRSLSETGKIQADEFRQLIFSLQGVDKNGKATNINTLLKSNPEEFKNIQSFEGQKTLISKLGNLLGTGPEIDAVLKSFVGRIDEQFSSVAFTGDLVKAIQERARLNETAIASERQLAKESLLFTDTLNAQIKALDDALNTFVQGNVGRLGALNRTEQKSVSGAETGSRIRGLTQGQGEQFIEERDLSNFKAQSQFKVDTEKLKIKFQETVAKSIGEQLNAAADAAQKFAETSFIGQDRAPEREDFRKSFLSKNLNQQILSTSLQGLSLNPAEITSKNLEPLQRIAEAEIKNLTDKRLNIDRTINKDEFDQIQKKIEIFTKIRDTLNSSAQEQIKSANELLESLKTSLDQSNNKLEGDTRSLTAKQQLDLRLSERGGGLQVDAAAAEGQFNLQSQGLKNQSFNRSIGASAASQITEDVTLQQRLNKVNADKQLQSAVSQQVASLNTGEFAKFNIKGLDGLDKAIQDLQTAFDFNGDIIDQTSLNELLKKREEINNIQKVINQQLEDGNKLTAVEAEKRAKELQLRLAFRSGRFSDAQDQLTNRIANGETPKQFGGTFKNGIQEQLSFTTADFYKSITDGTFEVIDTIKSGFSDAVASVAKGTKTIEDAFRDLAINVASKIIDRTTETAVNSLIGGLSGATKSLFSQGKANGGVISRFSDGGTVTGGSGTQDDVPALLTQGEYVIKKAAVSKYGKDFLENLNSRSVDNTLTNRFDYIGGTKPTGGTLNIDSNLSTFGALDENNPQNQKRVSREETLLRYLSDKANYDQQKQDSLKKFKKQQDQAIIGAFISAGIGIAGGALGNAFGSAASKTSTAGIDINKTVTSPDLFTGATSSAVSSSPGVYNQFNSGLNFDTFRSPSSYQNLGSLRFANGGSVFGGNQSTDTIPAKLTGGEFVVTKSAVDKYGEKFFENINNQRLGYATGGVVGGYGGENKSSGSESMKSVLDALGTLIETMKAGSTGNSKNAVNNNITISVTNNKDGSSKTAQSSTTDGDQNSKDDALQQAELLKGAILNIIQKEKRHGGELYGPQYNS